MKDPRTIEEQAAQLARWLDEHPGSAPPEGVDPDVLETIYALRPDLAPAPSFSIDDILAGVTTGPFASGMAEADAPPSGGELVELPLSEHEHEHEHEHEAPPAVVDLDSERRRRSPWLWSGLGAVAAAAMALVVAVPLLNQGISDEALYAPLQQEASSAPRPATIAEADPVAEAEPSPEPATGTPELAKKAEEREQDLARQLGPPPPASRDAAGPTASTTSRLGGLLDELSDGLGFDGSSNERDPAEQKELARREAQGAATPKDATAQQPPGRWYAPDSGITASPDEARPSSAPSGQTTPTAAPPAEPTRDPAPATVTGGYRGDLAASDAPAMDGDAADFDLGAIAVADDWEDEGGASADFSMAESEEDDERSRERSVAQVAEPMEEAESYELAGEGARSSDRRTQDADELESASAARIVASRSRGGGGGRSVRASKTRADNLEALDEAPAAAAAAAMAPSIDDLRAGANPLDYRSDWYQSDPVLDPATKAALAAAYGQVQASVVAGDISAARAALEPLLSSPHPRVIQDAACRLATLQLQQGQRSAAMATVERGLAASSSPTVHRSRLLAMRGGILEEQGDTQGAMDAYQQAIDANSSRY